MSRASQWAVATRPCSCGLMLPPLLTPLWLMISDCQGSVLLLFLDTPYPLLIAAFHLLHGRDLHVQLAVLLKGTPIRLPEPSELFNPTAIPIKTPSILMSSLQPLDPSMKVGPSQSYLKHRRSSHLYQGVLTNGKYNTKKPASLKNLILISKILLYALNFNPDGQGSMYKRHCLHSAFIKA